MDELASGLDVAAAIRAKEVSPLEVLDECLARVDVCNTELNAVIWRNDEEARAEARASSSLRQITALSSVLQTSTLARHSSSTSSGLTSLARMAAATSKPDASSSIGPG